MSQAQAEQQEHEQASPDEAFDYGFAQDKQDQTEGEQSAPEEREAPVQAEETVAPKDEMPSELPDFSEAVQEEQPAQEITIQPQPEVPKLEKVPEEIRTEFEELKQLSPEAAALALEDSPEGERLRKRLVDSGADSALDRAEIILDRRQRAQAEEQARQQALEAYNRNFRGVLEHDHPELFDPARNTSLLQDIRSWIENKPYAEAAPLMQVYMAGRDPHQVSALVSRFKQERTTAKAPDPTKAFAVPGRGAPIAPPGIGDKDDFEAGFNLK